MSDMDEIATDIEAMAQELVALRDYNRRLRDEERLSVFNLKAENERLERRLRQTQEEMAEYMRQHFWGEKEARIEELEERIRVLHAAIDEGCEEEQKLKAESDRLRGSDELYENNQALESSNE